MIHLNPKSSFDRESNTLRCIQHLNHEHLIKPIAAYKRGVHGLFIFPWASGGNLRDFWKDMDNRRNPRPEHEASLVIWVLNQMRGLAEALKVLHNKDYRHGDLKLENILRFIEGEGYGTLLIADVGLAKFYSVETQVRGRTSISTWSLRYEAPEICTIDTDNPLSRIYDIWSLGCTFIEFLIWLLYGADELAEFNDVGRGDKFWAFGNNGECRIHPTVQKWIDKMSTDLKADTALKDILELVAGRMLIVILSKGNESPAQGRAKADEVFARIDHTLSKTLKDKSYLLDASIWASKKHLTPQSQHLVYQGRIYQMHPF